LVTILLPFLDVAHQGSTYPSFRSIVQGTGHKLIYRCGDYASGTNHTLPTNGFARQFSGVNTLSFQKHITSQELTKEGLKRLGPVVITLAEREGLEAHANAVRVRLAAMDRE
jgi:histidinol dehydrogenase